MRKALVLALAIALAAVLLASFRIADGQGAPPSECPLVTGYEFHRKQEAARVLILGTSAASSPDSIAEECGNTRFCNAFTAAGDLLSVPMFPVFTDMEGDSSDDEARDDTRQSCAGTYVATVGGTFGLKLPDNLDFDLLRREGEVSALGMRATIAVAKELPQLVGWQLSPRMLMRLSGRSGIEWWVTAVLEAVNLNPQDAADLPEEILMEAFTTALAVVSIPLPSRSGAQTWIYMIPFMNDSAEQGNVIGNYDFEGILAAVQYPEWDSRFSGPFNFVSPVKDQGGLFFCNGVERAYCHIGWYAEMPMEIIEKKNLPYERNYPYNPYSENPSCALNAPPEMTPGGQFKRVFLTDYTAHSAPPTIDRIGWYVCMYVCVDVKAHIRKYGAVTSWFIVYQDFVWRGDDEPYRWDGYSALAGYHQVAVVGYSDVGLIP
ncbi:hypothetical protein VOLCADRAFT_97799 [Volvox carteri f. nagariensis]|uniref:Peptidase C1A papain C-terminal domain-containing protein n=1 Tax=Volvox carteri f. nagariensis TaxID=3068 RepID=D8UDN5_VOLCA|nr:uncharacterized protein VOLCADRAFT_97799 [Volvox carteri f. nagariensis]EFJ42071.1 hypothetical protein VOLCADRAFT_97799 [Volvox carteri f. nagariensis]|eukprot:XP_002956768.1 hypothetical protein VOLCADRAFT_97799 [Volvox carteri f. nagariensis]